MGEPRAGAHAALDHQAKYALVLVALAAAYIVSGRLGLLLAEHQENATLVWAPTGLSLAALLLGGRRLWPGVFGGALIVNLWVGTPLLTSLGIATGNTLEALLGAYLLTRTARLEPTFDQLRGVLSFLVLGAAACTLVSATCGVGSLLLGDRIAIADVPTVWLDWWLGDAGGAIVVAPVILVWARGQPELRALALRFETWIVMVLLALLAGAGFAGLVTDEWRLLAGLLVFPLVVWAGLRLGPRGAVTGSTVVSLIAIIGGSQGKGPFTGETSLYLTLAYVATTGMVAAFLAAAVAERDATEAERKRFERQADERQRLEELGVLAGGVAHDFNNLLVPITVNAELLRRHDVPEPEHNNRLDDIVTAAHRAGELCRQLLTYAGQTAPSREPVDLSRLTREMRRLLDASIANRVSFTVSLEDDVTVLGDPVQLRQLAMNLILNAAEACSENAGAVQVRASIEQVSADELARDELSSGLAPGRYAVFEVVDTGVGMSPETKQRIFQPFFTSKVAGRGLGLATVFGAVRAHDGAIVVDSALGQGSTFRVILPACEQKGDAVRPEPERARPISGSVLVADDDESVRAAVVRLLEEDGIDVITARDGNEAVEQFTQHGDLLDLVVLDVSMPGMDGKRALAEIRMQSADVPAVLMSGFTNLDLGNVLVGNTTFLPKPFPPQKLQRLAAEAVAARTSRQ